jgi:hypothetical protein
MTTAMGGKIRLPNDPSEPFGKRFERSEKMETGSARRRSSPHFFRTLLRIDHHLQCRTIKKYTKAIQHVPAGEPILSSFDRLDESRHKVTGDLCLALVDQRSYRHANNTAGHGGEIRRLNKSKALQSTSGGTHKSAPISGTTSSNDCDRDCVKFEKVTLTLGKATG